MQQHVYEYAILRIVPRVEREEFVNAGIVLYCKGLKYLQVRIALNDDRLKNLAPDFEVEPVKAHLHSFARIVRGEVCSSPIAAEPIAERFRWLTAVRSSTIQTSRPHPGLCADPEAELNRLLADLVL